MVAATGTRARNVGGQELTGEPLPPPKYPVYVPSKGRSDKCLTADWLIRDGIPFRLVVEPQDRGKYAARYGPDLLLTLDVDDPGAVVYARNWIKKHAEEEGSFRHWMLDDNIKAIKMQKGAKRVDVDSRLALSSIEEFVDRYENVGAASMRHTTFAWDAKVPFFLNQMVYCAMLVRTDLPYAWRTLAEDVDMSLQILSGGMCTVVTNIFQIDKAQSGSMKGGHTDGAYQGDGRLRRTKQLARQWPGLVKVDRRWGRPAHVMNGVWKKFDHHLIPKEPGG
jgi:hypothetical protein